MNDYSFDKCIYCNENPSCIEFNYFNKKQYMMVCKKCGWTPGFYNSRLVALSEWRSMLRKEIELLNKKG